jgi:hypothetical protein
MGVAMASYSTLNKYPDHIVVIMIFGGIIPQNPIRTKRTVKHPFL